MSLKYWTTGAGVFGLGLIGAVPVILGNRPPSTDAHEVKVWLLEFGIYICVTAFVWVAVAALALFLIRRIKQDIKDEQARNMHVLMESTLRDHERKKGNTEIESA